MKKSPKILCLITGRGGSKRVPRKNIKEFCGKPLITWSIQVARESGICDRLILSTDDEEIARVGKECGVEVPFIRPPELATDTAGSFSVLEHAVGWLEENEKYEAPWILLLEPSSPGRQPFHLKEAAEILKTQEQNIDSLVGISEIPSIFSYLKSLTLHDDNTLTRHDGTLIRNLIHCSQNLPTTYFINSSIYFFKKKNLFAKEPSLWGDKVYGYKMDSKYAMDINTQEDWLIAEIKMRSILKSGS